MVKPGIFGIPQSSKKHWMLREQVISPDMTLWYDRKEINEFFKYAFDEIWSHMKSMDSSDIVTEIIGI